MQQDEFQEKLGQSKRYGEIFDLVKRSVKTVLGVRRSGLMLYLEDLPLQIGAFHQVGSNGIVLNRRIIEILPKSMRSVTEQNSFIFTILLHEYLHSLGYIDEEQVKRLVYRISLQAFGPNHPTVQMALEPPFPRMPLLDMRPRDMERSPELVKDFEGSEQRYIV